MLRAMSVHSSIGRERLTAREARMGGTPGTSFELILAPDPPPWSAAQAFAYALGAPYHVPHGLPLNALPRPSGRYLRAITAALKREWSIKKREDLVRTLNWFGTQGQRRPHANSIRRYSLLRRPALATQREALLEAGTEDSDAFDELWRLDAVQADTGGIRAADLISFDAARATFLAREGYFRGWLSEQQLWDYLLDIARDVQRHFTSWADYAADFRLSRTIWLAACDDPQSPGTMDGIVELLLNHPQSPWRNLPWRVPGLEIPRPVRPVDPAAPVWTLERWDSQRA